MGDYEIRPESRPILGSGSQKGVQRLNLEGLSTRNHDNSVLRFANKSSNHVYRPRLHEALIDQVQEHPTFYKGLVLAAALAGAVAMLYSAAKKPEPDFMSAEDKAIMHEQIRLDQLYNSGVPLVHIVDDKGTYHTIPKSDYDSE